MGRDLQHPWGTDGIGDGIRQRELLVNAVQVFTNGTHTNSIPEDGIERSDAALKKVLTRLGFET